MEENARLSRELNKIDEKLSKKFCFGRSKLTYRAMEIECEIQDNEDEIKWNNDIATRLKIVDEKIIQRNKEAKDLIKILQELLENGYSEEEWQGHLINRVRKWLGQPEIK